MLTAGTPENKYRLSLIFNAGYIAVRIRQVQYNTSGIRMEGNWDYDFTNNAYAVWALTWHEQNKNWQYSATYAEDGKKKEVISYFDGTLRGRQTATLNSSDEVAIVQENIFDEFGRQAASILPAPVKEENVTGSYLHYFHEFNKNTSGTSYNFFSSAICKTTGIAKNDMMKETEAVNRTSKSIKQGFTVQK